MLFAYGRFVGSLAGFAVSAGHFVLGTLAKLAIDNENVANHLIAAHHTKKDN
jgi:hypothetical protein